VRGAAEMCRDLFRKSWARRRRCRRNGRSGSERGTHEGTEFEEVLAEARKKRWEARTALRVRDVMSGARSGGAVAVGLSEDELDVLMEYWESTCGTE
jgi:hypothetical protein